MPKKRVIYPSHLTQRITRRENSPRLSLNVLFLGLSLVVIDATPVKLDEATSKLIETSYNQGLRSGANNRLAFPSYDGINKIPIKIQYDFPAQINAPAPAPVAVAAPVPVAYAATGPVADAPVHVVPHAFETRVHYAETPVVVGHTSQIMKPNLGAGAHVTNFDDMGLAQTKNAAPEFIVQKSQILAPARTVSEITPQVTDQHRTEVNMTIYRTPERSYYEDFFPEESKPKVVNTPSPYAIAKKLLHQAIILLMKSPPPPPAGGAPPADSNESLEIEESNEVEESDCLARHQHLPTPPPVDVVKMLTDLEAANLL